MIKQTQTKMFDFSDVGLDFCAGSKNKFPEVFKKMLATGFNEQLVSSVTINGGQITLDYGVAHGYVADRVLKVTASGGFKQEVYIDNVDGQSVTCTVLDGNTTGLTGSISTKVASLGWDLVYEQPNVHIYKFKSLSGSDLFIRFCFQLNSSSRNKVVPCVGVSADLVNGTISDTNALVENSTITTPNNGFMWPFSNFENSTYDSYDYAQGYSRFGKGVVVGSMYHLIFASSLENSEYAQYLNALLPIAAIDYESISLPLMIGFVGEANWGYGQDNNSEGAGYIGSVRVVFNRNNNQSSYRLFQKPATNKTSFLPASIDSFNTTTTKPLEIFERSSDQFLGFALGAHECMFSSSNRPSGGNKNLPSLNYDIDFNNIIILHAISDYSPNYAFFAIPIEKIKYGI